MLLKMERAESLSSPLTKCFSMGRITNMMISKLYLLLPIPEILLSSLQRNMSPNSKIPGSFLVESESQTLLVEESRNLGAQTFGVGNATRF